MHADRSQEDFAGIRRQCDGTSTVARAARCAKLLPTVNKNVGGEVECGRQPRHVVTRFARPSR